jgi:hypothetical protein
MKVNEKALPGLDAPLTQSKPHVSNLPLRESDIRIQDLMKRIKDTSGIYDFSGIGYIKSYISHLLRNNIKKALMK